MGLSQAQGSVYIAMCFPTTVISGWMYPLPPSLSNPTMAAAAVPKAMQAQPGAMIVTSGAQHRVQRVCSIFASSAVSHHKATSRRPHHCPFQYTVLLGDLMSLKAPEIH